MTLSSFLREWLADSSFYFDQSFEEFTNGYGKNAIPKLKSDERPPLHLSPPQPFPTAYLWCCFICPCPVVTLLTARLHAQIKSSDDSPRGPRQFHPASVLTLRGMSISLRNCHLSPARMISLPQLQAKRIPTSTQAGSVQGNTERKLEAQAPAVLLASDADIQGCCSRHITSPETFLATFTPRLNLSGHLPAARFTLNLKTAERGEIIFGQPPRVACDQPWAGETR